MFIISSIAHSNGPRASLSGFRQLWKLPFVISPLLASSMVLAQQGSPATSSEGNTGNDTYKLNPVVVKSERYHWTQDWANKYTAPSSRAGSKLNLPVKEIPQQISVITEQRIEDQNLKSVDDVLNYTPGVKAQSVDSARRSYYSRGFYIDNFAFDGIPTSMVGNQYMGDGALSTAFFKEIDVVRGVDGMLVGTGNPGATVNFLYKHADSKDFTGSIEGSMGSWNNSTLDLDVGGRLNKSGTVRGRVIAGYGDGESSIDRYGRYEKHFYGMLDADLTDSTRLSLGYMNQVTHSSHDTWGGVPLLHTDGSSTHHSRHYSIAPKNSYNEFKYSKVYADLDHSFGNGWEWHNVASYTKTNQHARLAYITWATPASPTSSAGWGTYHGIRNMVGLDSYVSGPFTLFGREHQITAGVSIAHQRDHHFSNWGSYTGDELDDFLSNPSDTYIPNGGDLTEASDTKSTQRSVYFNSRWTIFEPLHVMLGGRYIKYRSTDMSGNMTKNKAIPYAAVTYDLNRNYTLFASYTSIFKPQNYHQIDGSLLEPVTGKDYEGGIKGSWNDGQITAAFSVFRIEQNNTGVATQNVIPGTGEYAYKAAKGVTSKGFEFELNGAVTQDLNLSFGWTHFIASDSEGPYNTFMPRTMLKLFGSYHVPQWQPLTVGGGINWQSRTYNSDDQRARQSSFAVVDMFGRYQFTPQFSVQANLNNVFDQKYYSYFDDYGVFGEPRNLTVAAKYRF